MLKGLKLVKQSEKKAQATPPPPPPQAATSVDASIDQPHASVGAPETAADPQKQQQQQQNPKPSQRESWMLTPPAEGLFASRGRMDEKTGEHNVAPGQQQEQPKPRELNPYWGNGGTGLPSERQQIAGVNADANADADSASSLGSGDFEWKRRSFLRAKERAEQEGLSVDEVIRERWGCSAAELLGGEEQLARVVAQDARRSAQSRDRFTAFYKSKMKRPAEGSELKWSSSRRNEEPSVGSAHGQDGGEGTVARHRQRVGGREKEVERVELLPSLPREMPASLPRAFGSTKAFPHRQQERPRVEKVQPPVAAQPSAAASVATTTITTPLSAEEINKLAAKALKAQLMGDKETFEKLNAQVEEAKRGTVGNEKPNVAEVVILPEYDIKGRRIAPSSSLHNPVSAGGDIREVAKRMKETGGFEDTRVMRRSMMHTRGDTEEDFDKMSENMFDEDKKRGKRKRGKHGARNGNDDNDDSQRAAKRQQIREHNKMKSLFDECKFCYTGKNFRKNLVLSLGEKSLLMLPPFGQLVPHHCVITTVEHRLAITLADEDEANEILRFKQCLMKMFLAQDKECLFLETVTPFQLQKQKHTILECIPVPTEVAQQASGYFKKAILDSDAEWSQNKKLIDTRGKGVRRCVPKDFPYFHVEFGLSGGFAHVIEDESKFPFTFGKQVIAGMLKMPPNAVKVHNRTSTAEEDSQRKQFLAIWKDYDWTVSLDGGEYR